MPTRATRAAEKSAEASEQNAADGPAAKKRVLATDEVVPVDNETVPKAQDTAEGSGSGSEEDESGSGSESDSEEYSSDGSDEEPDPNDPGTRMASWDGPPTKRRHNGDTYYLAFILAGERYAIGDCALFYGPEDKPETLYLARIDNMWEDCCGVMWTELMWYMSPEEMHCGRLPAHGAKELFETNRSDETEVASVKRKVRVLPKKDYDALDAEALEDSDTFFCRYHYDPRTKKVLPLLNSVLKSRVEGQYRNPRMGADRLLAFSGPASEAPEGVPSARNVGLGPEEDETADGTSAAPASKFDRAAHMLQLSTVPKTLPCREEEQGQIRAVLREAIQQGQCGGCIYISGVPGTGKTASVHAIIREMTRESESGELPPFSFIEVNCQRLPKPNHLYSLLLQGITGKQAQPVQAATMLDSLFGSAAHARQPTTVVLLDELDHLVTRKQTVLYNMFEWPTRAKANLVVLGVANTMDLPERMLPRIVSRLGLRRISFQPYLHTQLQEVISSRLGQLDAFDATAIQLCARRVAAVSGDVRKALHICRRACDLAREDGVDKVALKHIEAAVKQLFANPYVAAVQTLSHTAQLLLLAALQACEDLAEADVRVDEVTARATELARALGRGETPWSHVEAALATLFDMHLLAARGAPGCRPDRCAPQVLADDVAFALKDDPSLARIAATLA